jgi:hypothetical protein
MKIDERLIRVTGGSLCLGFGAFLFTIGVASGIHDANSGGMNRSSLVLVVPGLCYLVAAATAFLQPRAKKGWPPLAIGTTFYWIMADAVSKGTPFRLIALPVRTMKHATLVVATVIVALAMAALAMRRKAPSH